MTRIIFLISMVTICISSCNSQTDNSRTKEEISGLINKQDNIDKFWNWFQVNEKALRDFQTDPDKIMNQIIDSSKKIHSGLAIEFEPPKDNIINVTISADGDRTIFPLVKEIVAKAPRIEGWSFVAFRQRVPKEKVRGMILKAQDHELNPDKMKFYPISSGDSLDIIIYANNITEENYNQVAYGGLVLLDNILGEYDCVTKIRGYDFKNMPTSETELKNLMPLVDLPDFVDNFYRQKRN